MHGCHQQICTFWFMCLRNYNCFQLIIEKTYYNATIEIFPAQESYEIGTQVTLRCTPPPSFHWRSPRITWRSTSTTRFYYGSNFTFVIPSHYPNLVNYYCFVYGGRFYFKNVLLGRGKVTLKIKGIL